MFAKPTFVSCRNERATIDASAVHSTVVSHREITESPNLAGGVGQGGGLFAFQKDIPKRWGDADIHCEGGGERESVNR
jgi:hypothetical protein